MSLETELETKCSQYNGNGWFREKSDGTKKYTSSDEAIISRIVFDYDTDFGGIYLRFDLHIPKRETATLWYMRNLYDIEELLHQLHVDSVRDLNKKRVTVLRTRPLHIAGFKVK